MVREIDALRKANESLGGVFEVQAFGLVPGLGSHISWEERLDGRLAMAICSIQAIKGVAIGDGFAVAGVPGSQAHDEIFYSDERGYYRETNRAGGLEGGMTTGEPLIVRGAMKPLPTLTKPLRSVDTATHEPAQALRERTDSCTVPAAGVVGEAMVALVLADAYRREVRRRPHRRRAAGRRRLRGADRVAFVLIGFMGAGKSTVAGAAGRAPGRRRRSTATAAGGALRHPVAREFELHGEEAFRADEEELVCGLLDERRAQARDRARRRQRALRAVRDGARRPRDRAARRRSRRRLGARRRAEVRAGHWRDRAFLLCSRADSTTARRRDLRLPRALAARWTHCELCAAPAVRAAVGELGVRATTRYSSAAACSASEAAEALAAGPRAFARRSA